jgi:phosphonatase-like hydrolase
MIVFDMAGTTVNEDNVVYKTLLRSINEEGFDLTLEQVLAEGAGKEKLQAIKSISSVYAGRNDEDLAQRVYGRFIVQLAAAYDAIRVLPQPHAEELFRALKQQDRLVILNTGYDTTTAQSLITKLGWSKGAEFDGLVTATDVSQGRPAPDMILLAMEKFGIRDADQVAKVGDSMIDIEEGKNAGCRLTIGITTGAHTAEQLLSAQPDHIIDDLFELLPILDEENKK